MTNNDRLLIIQRALKLDAQWIAYACFCKPQTVYSWRKKIKGQFHRSMPDASWQLLMFALITQGKITAQELDALLTEC